MFQVSNPIEMLLLKGNIPGRGGLLALFANKRRNEYALLPFKMMKRREFEVKTLRAGAGLQNKKE